MAPILSFTAEEIWGSCPRIRRGRERAARRLSVVDPALRDPALAAEWDTLLAVRSAVTKTLEGLRSAGTIGHFASRPTCASPPRSPVASVLASHRATPRRDLHRVAAWRSFPRVVESDRCSTSAARRRGRGEARRRRKVSALLELRDDAGRDPNVPAMCARCVGVLAARGHA
jgi:isoleucyl-tRNA synthetase